jgi:UDP-N-acetyl-D-glucosamine dehydrogenase
MKSVALNDQLDQVDAVIICTDHDAVDYELIARKAPVILDTRDALRKQGLETDALFLA